MADAGAASLRVSGLELGGLFGSLLAGKLSDMLINNSKGGGGNVGKRIQVRRVGGGGGGGGAELEGPEATFWLTFGRSLSAPPCRPPQVVIAYTLGIAAMLMAFAATPASMGWLQWATVFMIGFFLYGPQVMHQLCCWLWCCCGSSGGCQGRSRPASLQTRTCRPGPAPCCR